MNKEPLVRIKKRDAIPVWKAWVIRLISLLLALIVCGFIIYAIVNSIRSRSMGLCGTALSVPREERGHRPRHHDDALHRYRAGPRFQDAVLEHRAEGQILVGGIATAACMIYLGGTLPTWLMLLVMAAARSFGRCRLGPSPRHLQGQWGTNETLFTLMMNYIGIQLTSYFVSLWENPYGSNSVGIINQKSKSGWFPAILEQQYL